MTHYELKLAEAGNAFALLILRTSQLSSSSHWESYVHLWFHGRLETILRHESISQQVLPGPSPRIALNSKSQG